MSSEPVDTSFRTIDLGIPRRPSTPPPALLDLDDELRAIRVDAGPTIDLARRRVLRALLAALVAAHLESPRRSLSTEELVQHVWPGDRSPLASARNRLYFAVSALRALGLRELVVRSQGGYALVDHVVVGRL